MATALKPEKFWTVQEYLRTSWSPDRELVTGESRSATWAR
jgi:hypothetical protein